MRKVQSLMLVFLFLSMAGTASAETINPTVDEKINVKCECLASFSLCELEIFLNAAGKPKISWYQDAYLKAGVPADLDQACYRKRDVPGNGAGLCCTFPGDEAKTVKNLFRGAKQ